MANLTAPAFAKFVLIWSGEHRLWWRAEGHGYTDNLAEAGPYSVADAEMITSNDDPQKALSSQTMAEAMKRNFSTSFCLRRHMRRAIAFSLATFGPGDRSAGVVAHIRKELLEIEAKPDDLEEWIDVAILAFDGAWRAGYTADEIVAALAAKQAKNEARTWPDWRTASPDALIEHVKAEGER